MFPHSIHHSVSTLVSGTALSQMGFDTCQTRTLSPSRAFHSLFLSSSRPSLLLSFFYIISSFFFFPLPSFSLFLHLLPHFLHFFLIFLLLSCFPSSLLCLDPSCLPSHPYFFFWSFLFFLVSFSSRFSFLLFSFLISVFRYFLASFLYLSFHSFLSRSFPFFPLQRGEGGRGGREVSAGRLFPHTPKKESIISPSVTRGLRRGQYSQTVTRIFLPAVFWTQGYTYRLFLPVLLFTLFVRQRAAIHIYTPVDLSI